MGNRTNTPATSTTRSKLDPGKIDFVGKSVLFGCISIFLVIASFAIIMIKGLNYGIDFAGGTEIRVQFGKHVSPDAIRSFVKRAKLPNAEVQAFSGGNEYLIRFQTEQGKTDKETDDNMKAAIANVTEGLKSQLGNFNPVIRQVDSVGPQVGQELKRNAVLALFYSLLIILIYVALRFDYKYAPGAVFCLFHDAIIVVGIFALMGKEINVQIMAAVLTLIGYSLNDTIVNYDRIRENVAIYKGEPLDIIINKSINEVLGRTLLTVVTLAIAVSCLYLWAGGVIQEIALALGIGIFFGTYSSIYVAAPLVLVGEKLRGLRSSKPAAVRS